MYIVTTYATIEASYLLQFTCIWLKRFPQHQAHLCVVVNEDAYVVSVADGALCDPRPRPLPMDVDAGSTERRVCEVTVVR